MMGGYASLFLLAAGAVLGGLAVMTIRLKRPGEHRVSTRPESASDASADRADAAAPRREDRMEKDIAQMRADLDLLVGDYVMERAANMVDNGLREEKRTHAQRAARQVSAPKRH